MSGIWVDTDFGFDDLWALLVLRHYGCVVDGVSLVAGNAPLAQVARNAVAAKQVYGFDWPLWQGAARPLHRVPETAQRILGETGMRSRGARLDGAAALPPEGGVEAMCDWLMSDAQGPREVLALGPLTNIALALQATPELAGRITRLVWMGGSAGAGNHTPHAEFNAVADAEALAHVLAARVPIDIVDLSFCRTVTFGEGDMPRTDPLTRDLLGGYLDIALVRGRPGMAIYDPLAALAYARPGSIGFRPCTAAVSVAADETYGATKITHVVASHSRVSVDVLADLRSLCLAALEQEAGDGA